MVCFKVGIARKKSKNAEHCLYVIVGKVFMEHKPSVNHPHFAVTSCRMVDEITVHGSLHSMLYEIVVVLKLDEIDHHADHFRRL